MLGTFVPFHEVPFSFLQQEVSFPLSLSDQWSPSAVSGIAWSSPQSPSNVGIVGGNDLHHHSHGLEDEPSGSSTLDACSSEDNLSVCSSSGFINSSYIPKCWPPTIMYCIKMKTDEERRRALIPSVRNEIVRILATTMFSCDPSPKKDLCTKVAKMLVNKYGFMKDIGEHVSGYVSF